MDLFTVLNMQDYGCIIVKLLSTTAPSHPVNTAKLRRGTSGSSDSNSSCSDSEDDLSGDEVDGE